MPRRPRLVLPDVPLHIIQRGNNRQPCFLAESDYLVYLDHLQRGAIGAECDIHAYVLMGNHVHVLATPATSRSAGEMMKSVGERYVKYFNARYQRTGTLWDGRFKSCLIHDETYLLECYRYIELNPVRAGIVAQPLDYRWSSYRANAFGASDQAVTPHCIFDALASDTEERHAAYRALVAEGIAEHAVEVLRDATNHNYVCGTDDFVIGVEDALGLRAARKSRPIHPLRG